MRSKTTILLGCCVLWLAIYSTTGATQSDADKTVDTAATLRQLMWEQPRYVKLHAAEALLALGHQEGVYDAFVAEESAHGDVPQYRVVIWRVLARSAATETQRAQWCRRIVEAFLQPHGPDRLHAVESLAKLGYQIPPEEVAVFNEAATGEDEGLALFARWVLARNGKTEQHARSISNYLRSDDPITRLRAGYILRHLDMLPASVRNNLFDAAKAEPADSVANAYLAASAFVIAKRSELADHVAAWRDRGENLAIHGSASQRAAVCQGFAESGTNQDLPLMRRLLGDEDPDVRIFAVYAIAKIESRDRNIPMTNGEGRPEAEEIITRHEYVDPQLQTVVPYLLYRPASEPMPGKSSLLIYLHGASGSLENYNLKRKPYERFRKAIAKRGCYIVVPELGSYHFMNDDAKKSLDGIVAEVIKDRKIPADRIHIMGTSMGGGSALAYAMHRPDLIQSVCAVMPMTDFGVWATENPKYASILEVSYGGTPQTRPHAYDINSALQHPKAFENTPVYLIHGKSDTIVPYHHSEQLAILLQTSGYTCTLRLVEDMGHSDAIIEEYQSEVAEFFVSPTE